MIANNTANELFSVVQPQSIRDFFQSSSKDKKRKKEWKKVEANISFAIKQIQQFRATNSLGVYGKARLQHGFNNRLLELGYDSEDVRKLNDFILIRMP